MLYLKANLFKHTVLCLGIVSSSRNNFVCYTNSSHCSGGAVAPPSDSSSDSSSSSSSEAAAGPFGGEAVASGKKVVRELLQKLAADSDLLPVKVVEIDTVICQNDCSGHGTCHQVKCFNYTPLTSV